jgi:hypothetical protein
MKYTFIPFFHVVHMYKGKETESTEYNIVAIRFETLTGKMAYIDTRGDTHVPDSVEFIMEEPFMMFRGDI